MVGFYGIVTFSLGEGVGNDSDNIYYIKFRE